MAVRGTRAKSAVISRIGAALGKTFQILPARIHQSDDDRGEALPEHERAGHGEGGNDVQADIPAPEAGNDLDKQARSGPGRSPRPRLCRTIARSRQDALRSPKVGPKLAGSPGWGG